MTTTDLTTTTSQAMAPAGGVFAIAGLEGLEQSDLIIPRWSIVQPTSRREDARKHTGEFVRNIDNVFRASVETVILQVTRSRILWSGDLADKAPECVSRDAVVGSRYGACGQCDFNPGVNVELARDLANGTNNLKVCNFGYTFLAVDDLEAESLAFLGAMGTSVRAAKSLITQFVTRKRPPFAAVVTWETEETTNKRGVFYVLKPSVTRWLDPAEVATYAERHEGLRGATLREHEDTDDSGNAPTDAPPF